MSNLNLVNRWALRWAASRVAPDRIPLSNDARLLARNYYSVYLNDTAGHSYLMDRAVARGIEVREYDGEMYSNSTTIYWDEVASLDLQFVQYFSRHEFHFASATGFLAAQLTQKHRFVARYDDVQQRLYNSRTLVRAERVQLLTTLAERAVEPDGPWVTEIELMRMANSSRMVRHPDFRRSRAQLHLHLQALVHSADAEVDGNFAYRLAPQGLTTLSQLVDQERRHEDMRRLQFGAAAFAALTAIGVLVKTEQIQEAVMCGFGLLKGWVLASV